jgi:hypothetical protein
VGNVRRACTFKLIQDDLGDGLSHGNTGLTHLPLTEVIAPCFEVVVLGLSVLEREVPHCMLACEIMAICMFALPSIGTSVRHLIVEVAVMTGYAAPSGGSGGAEEMGGFAVGGNMVEPRAIGTVVAFLVLILHQSIVLRILAVPGNGASRPTPQV